MTEQDKSKIASLLDDHDPAISSLYRDSAQDMPPTSLDDKILRAAHAAAASQEEAPIIQKPRRPWPLLGGLAASVLVAVLAVNLLPHSLQSPPALKERATVGTSEADRLAPKSASPPSAAVSEPMPASPIAAPEKRIQQDVATENLADELETKAERKFATGMAADRAETSMPSAAPDMPEEMGTAASISRDQEFNSIAALWKTGNTAEAIALFETFQKQHPDYTPSSTDLPVFQALQSALETKIQPYEEDVE
jgi:hypothetical protein